MKILVTTIAASVIVSLAACAKKEPSALKPQASHINSQLAYLSVQPSHSLLASAPANPQNPYDYIGYYHNIGLDSLRHYVKATSDTTRLGRQAYLSRYFKLNYGATVKPFYCPGEKLICTDYRAVMLTQKVSAPSQAFFQALSDALQSIRDFDHYEAYKEQVMAVETKVLATELPADEKKNLLITAAILRYSGYYWMDAFESGEVTEHFVGLPMPDSFLRKIAGVITGIAADASIIAFSTFWSDPDILGNAITMSECCGYYTGWY